MLAILEKFDIFGVPIKLKTIKQQEQFKTSQSGVIAIIIMMLSLAYFVYVMQQWINGQLIPKVTTYEWENGEISFTLYDLSTQINPFTKQNNIIMPVLLEISGLLVSAQPRFLYSTQQVDGDKNVITIDKGKLVLSQVDGSKADDQEEIKQYFIFFTKCRSDWMEEGGYCADQQVIDDYFSINHGLLFLSINLQQYNYENLEFDEIKKTQFFAFEESSPFYSQVILQKQRTTVDKGILFNSFEYFDVIKDYQVITQAVTKKFAQDTIKTVENSQLEFETLGTFVFRIDNIEANETILMPKLGEVLAQIGSIVNMIMLLKLLSNMINTTMLESAILHQIIEIYYPQFKQVQITKNFLGQVKEVRYKGVEIKLTQFKHKYNELLEIARAKFTFNNLIQELSRVQLVLVNQIGMENLKKIFKKEEDLKFFEQDRSPQTQCQVQNLVSVSPEESPKIQEFERFVLFSSDFSD
ncbi:unnamed protein product (macronuclear) [Paramecium tetraurelia]|uniref:Transmembrane protein n=1 Tax=Paramecium tetraurelia TaxID=5888 RepID=A0C900_PARTE|nr:uncharacterized protein GSPATT00006573001 [Paramecium tetraurelia]CAK67267.1 unnamed protein product [Paramecium tetraurelia]|eukprot:XP_001434664.1 hypothetical protein (macronuclear) [Paramecium tetraurelia strain d4-2]